ncbi:ABC transporter ATP-binding protein/permease, partial [Candidatus Frankia alpina]
MHSGLEPTPSVTNVAGVAARHTPPGALVDAAAVSATDVRIRRGARRHGRGGHEVIHGVTFTVPRGSVTGVIG